METGFKEVTFEGADALAIIKSINNFEEELSLFGPTIQDAIGPTLVRMGNLKLFEYK